MTNLLELRVRCIARMLHDHQVARLFKIPNDMKLAGGVLIYGEQSPADFLGWTVSGRAIALECKEFKELSLPLGPKGLKPHQLIAITECHKAGGIGLLAWQRGDELAVIDPDQIRAYSRGRKSIPWKAIPARYKRPADCSYQAFFWPFIGRPAARGATEPQSSTR